MVNWFFHKSVKIFQWRKNNLLKEWHTKLKSMWEEWSLGSLFYTIYKNSFDKDINVTIIKAIKLLEESRRVNLYEWFVNFCCCSFWCVKFSVCFCLRTRITPGSAQNTTSSDWDQMMLAMCKAHTSLFSPALSVISLPSYNSLFYLPSRLTGMSPYFQYTNSPRNKR